MTIKSILATVAAIALAGGASVRAAELDASGTTIGYRPTAGQDLGVTQSMPGIPVVPGIPITPGVPVTTGVPIPPGIPVTPGIPITTGIDTTPGGGTTTLRELWAHAERERTP